ncbi:MAG TPA: MBL fold metallo-hydrolase [Candidatus Babeliales bacterium]|nr:MBL fold metallo-hydrolase [Candidatus Babeliales bacterium]
MKVTRFTQSCLLIEEQGSKILIDPSADEKDSLDAFGQLDAVLYTHEHHDHFDAELAKTFVEQAIAPVYANASTAKLIEASKTVVEDGQELKIGNFTIKAIGLPHCKMPNGSAGPQNTGYLINGNLFHPGDGVELDGLKVDNLALPITGPDVSMKDAFAFAKKVQAKVAIPIHYDKLGAHPDVYANFAGFFPDDFKFSIKPLAHGESSEII